ncbi:hypothetical protein AGOR_G00147020 [Albula goreensis]|uniref:Uncharacterized protein n=1 Tax=Albula goreensis TaxID=1534307 RepID=A0A8T3D808_9TELE|nr:hypothetical protein AGOR_G00147020 [Albula goreensis]
MKEHLASNRGGLWNPDGKMSRDFQPLSPEHLTIKSKHLHMGTALSVEAIYTSVPCRLPTAAVEVSL